MNGSAKKGTRGFPFFFGGGSGHPAEWLVNSVKMIGKQGFQETDREQDTR